MKQTVILYHANCRDGFGGAWAAWKVFGTRATYIPLQHQATPVKGLVGKDVYFIDIVYSSPLLKDAMQCTRSLTVIDHHLTARRTVAMAPMHVFDIKHSGAVLAWKFFHKNKAVPKLLRYVEESDLWRFRLPHARAISAALDTIGFSFREWDIAARHFENQKQFGRYVHAGSVILNYQQTLVHKMLAGARSGTLGRTKLHILNSPVLESELGNALAQKKPGGALIWSEQKSRIRVSLRSRGNVNVAALARRYGGGGHKYAAGFKFDAAKPRPWKYR